MEMSASRRKKKWLEAAADRLGELVNWGGTDYAAE
jgi:hypothetical protein